MSTSTTQFDRSQSDDVSDKARDHARKGADSIEDNATEMASAAKRGADDLAETVTTKLKTVGVDTDVMATAAKEHASELQRMIGDEMQRHPVRALGIAAAIGVFVGLMTAK